MELLRQFGFKKIEMVDPQYDETKIKKKIPINKLVVELSFFKAKSVSNKLKNQAIQKFLGVKRSFLKLIPELRLENIYLNYPAGDTLFMEGLQ